ncbi:MULTISPECIES: hypothetical protein [unclassified Pseudonocardia]|jgi:hypothetical protein|uniref:hypothetical protein n=1 Tax=unclassified Pseudonocardia TaxID=2619320 RepID=UPI00095DBDF7|nr:MULTISPECIES: hypothetical protein [unclassified Pseudonocardia]MBN9097557.1 hypothetical protein [Pseudonocardia sp.]OJY39877.1 MAG: hypothetical protein BGP03_21625 [Pseudonocardia sp. 73-21]
MAILDHHDEPTEVPTIRRRRRGPWIALALVVAVVLAGTGGVVLDALRVPGSDGLAAKLAEWGRDHGFGPVVTWLEQIQYESDKPAVGGVPQGGIPTAGGVAPGVGGSERLPSVAMPPLAGGAQLPGEGVWQTVVTVKGRPAVQVASVRPDAQHTSFVVGVMRMDPTLVRGQLHPGTLDPGGSWRTSTSLVGAQQADVVAAFNGGFRLTDPSHPGYYAEGRPVKPLVDGVASLVLRADGTADVGAWNREVRMAPGVVSVRQNLLPLVDGGQVNPTCATGGTKEWGSTIGQAAYVHRSGFGVTATGVEVYVGGPALSVCTLGRILQDAGVVRGMELDINPNWVSGTYFHDRPGAAPQGFRLFPAEKVDPAHYLTPTSRDWFAWYAR